MREWQKKTIGDLVTLQRGIDLPDAERKPGSVPIIGSFGITGRHNEAVCKGPGVTVGRSGASAGVVCYIQKDFWPLNTCLYVRDFKGNHPRFAYYFLKTFDLASLNSGSAQPSLNRNFVHPVPAAFPEPPEQAAIASVLGTLDDKIELNRRINETLEAMARAIFKDWFVDFGPTRAKMECSKPYLAPDLWSLFPDRLDGDGKPEGRDTKPLRFLGETNIGGFWGLDEPQAADDIQFLCLRGVDLEHLRTTGACPEAPIRWGKRSAIEKRPVTDHDVLIAGSGAGPCGRPLWLSSHVTEIGDLPVSYSNFVKRITCPSSAKACFLDRHLHEMRLSGEIWSYVNGTSVPNLNDQGLLDGKIVVIPPENLLSAFVDIACPIMARLFQPENRVLAATRDLLLPKLISGEIRIRDAEKTIETAS
jgi:type I restriction enzyme, S subunit